MAKPIWLEPALWKSLFERCQTRFYILGTCYNLIVCACPS